jgi:MULE transposase domain
MSSAVPIVPVVPVPFNLSIPARLGDPFYFIDEDNDASVSWCPHPDLSDGIRNRLVDAVRRVPRAWLMLPADGEVFDSYQAGQERVLGYSLAAGFETVGGSGSTAIRKNILCRHHGEKTANWRGLSHKVVKDKEGKITSSRKREDTRTWADSCLWRCYLVPNISEDEEGNVTERWILHYGKKRGTGELTDSHSHDLAQNPLLYPTHQTRQPHFQQAIPQATAMRQAHLPFRYAERILHGQDLKIDRVSYYNLARAGAMKATTEGLLALVTVLERDNWIYRTLWDLKKNDAGAVTAKVLKAVFFTNKDLVRVARRFCPNWVIQVDGTFNTNAIRMPLIDCLGVSNTSKSFLFAFCFVTSESADNWGFVLKCLEEIVFDGLPLPRVVIADQGKGLRAVFHQVWTNAFLQFCEWHAADNMKKRLAQQKYKKDERKAIMELVWRYIWSSSVDELEINRATMKAAMRVGEQQYIDKYWVCKEKQVIRAYTAFLPNVNCFSTQRDEGQHPMIKSVLHHQLPLDQGVVRLGEEMVLAIERLQESEQLDQMKKARVLEDNTWYLIRNKVASWPLKVIEKQWSQLTALKLAREELDECQCGFIERFGLPCLHILEYAWDHNLPLPITLIHSRWWYQAGVERSSNWQPTYASRPLVRPVSRREALERPSHEIASSTNQLLQFRDTLNREAQEQLDRQHTAANTRLLHDAKVRQAWDSTIPRELPPPILQSWNRKAKSHDKVSKRLMTGTEVAVQEADRYEAVIKNTQATTEVELQYTAAEVAKITAEVEIDDELLNGLASEKDSDSDHSEIREVVFCTPISPPRAMLPPPIPTTPGVGRKRSITLVHRTPEKPREAPFVPTTPSNTISRETSTVTFTPQEPTEIPTSTAPARLDGRERRVGKNSVYLEVMARERGRGRGGRGGRGGKA